MARNAVHRVLLAAIVAIVSMPATAQHCFWSHIDHRVTYDASGAWKPSVYRDIVGVASIAEVAGALWEGADSRFGRTMWQGIDSEIISVVASEAGKYVFTRVRPATEDNPCLWFQGGHNHSFPSSEASVAAGLVTPYVYEYGADYPAVYALLLLPAYVGAGRVKNQAHWQTDVLAGWAIGGVSGWYAHSRDVPITVELLPHGLTVGLHAAF